MKWGPIIAVVFAFFLIAIYPYYVNDELPLVTLTDDDGDGITNDKDLCPNEDASLNDINKDGCLDSEITKEEVDYLEKLSKFNLGQYFLFAILSLIGTIVFIERENIKLILYSDEEPSAMKNFGDNDKEAENVNYDELGEVRDYKPDGTFYGRIRIQEITEKIWKEADINIQLISLICILCFLFVPTSTWFNVTGYENLEYNDDTESSVKDFTIKHYIDHLEYATDNGKSQKISYNSELCTNEIDQLHNCDYRTSLFQTIDLMIQVVTLLCVIVFLLSFRIDQYRLPVSAIFCLALILTMAILLLFTSLIDKALISDEVLLDTNQRSNAGCWMMNPIIWGEGNCMLLTPEGDVIVNEEVNYTPGISFFIVLTSISLLFIGLFTDIYPLLNQRKITWTEAARENWQVFAIIATVIFLWRVNIIVYNM